MPHDPILRATLQVTPFPLSQVTLVGKQIILSIRRNHRADHRIPFFIFVSRAQKSGAPDQGMGRHHGNGHNDVGT
jgi:hypothetical protein